MVVVDEPREVSQGEKRPDERQTEQGKSMARHVKRHPPSEATQDEALQIARGTQRPGQTKEQTKLIAQGIQKGIEQYKKQQSARTRELDKNLKKVKQQFASPEKHEIEVQEKVVYGRNGTKLNDWQSQRNHAPERVVRVVVYTTSLRVPNVCRWSYRPGYLRDTAATQTGR